MASVCVESWGWRRKRDGRMDINIMKKMILDFIFYKVDLLTLKHTHTHPVTTLLEILII